MSHSEVFVQMKRPMLKPLSLGPQRFSAVAVACGGGISGATLDITRGSCWVGKAQGNSQGKNRLFGALGTSTAM